MQFLADLLFLFDCGVVILELVCVFKPNVAIEFGGMIVINNVAENTTLAFTFVYRFEEFAREKGWRKLLRDDKREIACHVVFMLHEYLFMLLENLTHVSWEYLQAIFMRLAFAPCLDDHRRAPCVTRVRVLPFTKARDVRGHGAPGLCADGVAHRSCFIWRVCRSRSWGLSEQLCETGVLA